MYKNIKVLRKNENLKNRFSKANIEEKLQATRLIPLGIDEIMEYCSSSPIVISRGDEAEFALFVGLSPTKNIFVMDKHIKEPAFLRNYPFMMLHAKNEQDEDVSVIGLDMDEKFVGEDKESAMFDENENPTKEVQELMDNVQLLHAKREMARGLLKELKSRDLLMEQSFNLNVDGKIQPVLSDYLIVDRRKIYELDDATLALWTKKGWMGIIDAHIYSIRNFQKIVDLVK